VVVTNLHAPAARMNVLLGDGDDTFEFADSADVTLRGVMVDGGAGTNTYLPGVGNDFDFLIQLRNFA
jgi:hypothetical protein